MSAAERKQIPVLEGLFHIPSAPGQQPYLIGSRCRSCGYVAFPKKVICPACLGEDTMAEVPLSRRGVIETFTVSRVAPPGFTAPYIQAYVHLPEGPRLFSIIAGREEEIEMGQDVELIIDKIAMDEAGNELIGYKFRPVSKGG